MPEEIRVDSKPTLSLSQTFSATRKSFDAAWPLPTDRSSAVAHPSVLHSRAQDTAIAEAQAQAYMERQRYQELFDALPHGILVTSGTGEIREINSYAARLLHVRPGQATRHRILEYLLDPDELSASLAQLNEGKPSHSCRITVKPRRGEPFPADLTLTRLAGDADAEPQFRWMLREAGTPGAADPLFLKACEELRAAHASAQDVTLRRLAELEEANRRLEKQIADRRRVEDDIVNRTRDLERRLEKRTSQYQEAVRGQDSTARFLAEICANPLRALDVQARQILDRWGHSLPQDGRRQMSSVLARSRELNDLLESVATYARVAKQPLERRMVDTAALVSEVLQSLEPEFAGRCVEMRVGDLMECSADPSLLRLVFHHLLSNALKFTRSREAAAIEVQCSRAGDEIVWMVRDNGLGFRKEQAFRLFQPFQRLHRTLGYDGAGVGLATACRIVSRHDGRIWAESNSNGIGATFFFALPVRSS